MSLEHIEDVYPLSPVQEGMLFHSIYDPEGRVYDEQLSCTLSGELSISAFADAWQKVVDRHPILRTACIWEGIDEPVQVVYRHLDLRIELQDWRGLPVGQQQEQLIAYLEADRQRGIELSTPPLMRLTLIQMADDRSELVWSYHHLLLDGWSVALVLKEVFAYYAMFRHNRNIPVVTRRPYRDYIAWLQQQNMSTAERFWRQTLKGFASATPLVLDRLPDDLVDKRGGHDEQQVQLSKSTTAALFALASRQQLTLNTFVRGAWAILLSRYSGEKDIVFGATVSGRPATIPEIESRVGLFINTLPVRVHVPDHAALVAWLKELQAQQAQIHQYEYTPLARVQEWSEVPRGQPLFESILVFENYPIDTSPQEQNSGLSISNVRFTERTNYPLTVIAYPGAALVIKIAYECQRFTSAAIRLILGHLQMLLEGMVANPQCRLCGLSLLTPAEYRQIVFDWNNTRAVYTENMSVQALFEAQVERTPDGIAVVFQDLQLTYWELNRRANRLAAYLRCLDVRPDVLVGICIERSLEMVVGLLGILKAGGAYVPLDPAYPRERIAFMVEDAQVPVILTQKSVYDAQLALGGLCPTQPSSEDLHDRTKLLHPKVICLDTSWQLIEEAPAANLACATYGDNLAYVIYTSGSTGKPKGAMNAHRAICNRLLWMQSVYQLTESDRILQKTPFSFDVSVWEFFWPLLAGARLVVARPEGHRDNAYLAKIIAEQSVTTLHFVPSMLQLFLEQEGLETCTCLKRVICSGELLTFDLQERFLARLDAELHNLYGPTEAAIDVTFWPCGSKDRRRIVPIGRPIANIQIYLLDGCLQSVPVGIPGELHIGGVGLARGYLNRPMMTAEKFIPNPFVDQRPTTNDQRPTTNAADSRSSFVVRRSSDRLYKTGDRARYLPDGGIEYLGRLDYQVKIRGYRIEPEEIETILGQHPTIQQTTILAREDTPGNKRLVAYVVPHQGQMLTASDLRLFLKEKIPNYMVPSAFLMLETLPLTPNGKIDRRALPAPDRTRPDMEATFVAPRTPEEQALAEIWSQVLGVERVGIHDPLFDLGGDSLLAIRIVARANQAGYQLTVRHLFQHPTVADLAAAVGKVRIQAEQAVELGPIPFTPSQLRFFEWNCPNVHYWNMGVLLAAREVIAPAILEKALQHVALHHDVFQVRLVQTESGCQLVDAAPGQPIPFEYLDLSSLTETKQQLALEAAITQAETRFNLAEEAFLKVILFDLGPYKPNHLMIVGHFLALDIVAFQILVEDLHTAYQQLNRGQSVQFPAKTISFKQWARRLTEYVQSTELQQELPYWLREPRSEIGRLPVDNPEGANTVASTRTVAMYLSTEETQTLVQEILATHRAQIGDALLTALAQVLVQWTGSYSLLIGMTGHGREALFEDMDTSRTIGWFQTMFPVLLDLRAACDLGEALQVVKEELRHVPHGGIGYGLLRYLSNDKAIIKQLQPFSLPEVVFNHMGPRYQVMTDLPLFRFVGGLSGWQHDEMAMRPLLLGVTSHIDADGRLQVEWDYSEQVYQRATVERLAQHFIKVLRSVIGSSPIIPWSADFNAEIMR